MDQKVVKEITKLHMTRVSFSTSDKFTKKIIAPFVNVAKKGPKPKSKSSQDSSYYFGKKPSSLTLDLYKYLNDSYELTKLLSETTNVLKTVTNATGSVLYLVDSSVGELIQYCHFQKESKLLAVWKIETTRTVAAYVAKHKEYIIVDDVWEDTRFPDGAGWKGPNIKSVICVPVVDGNNECLAVIELYKDSLRQPFTTENLKIVIVVVSWMGATIDQNSIRISLQKERDLNDYLLNITQLFCNETTSINKIITDIVKFAKQCVSAEQGRFFIIQKNDEGLMADVYEEGIEPIEKGQDILMYNRKLKVRLSSDKSIVGTVAQTGKMLNVKDMYNDPNYKTEFKSKTLLINRSILCLPILGANKEVIGVIEMINKLSAPCFTSIDEILLEKFAAYCSLTVHFANMHKRLSHATNSNKISSDLTDCLIGIYLTEKNTYEELKDKDIPSNFRSFNWHYTPEIEQIQIPLCLYMIQEVVGYQNVNVGHTINIISLLKRCHRPNPFHNFEHAFNTCHLMFNLLIRNLDTFTLIEREALIMAALSFIIGHLGYSNNFLRLIKHPLTELYEESPKENYNYNLAKRIIGDGECFINLTGRQIKEFNNELKEAILATDLVNYFRSRTTLKSIIINKSFDWTNVQHRKLVKSILIILCHLHLGYKPYSYTRSRIENLYKEFYIQGDIEKAMNLKPIISMDREKFKKAPVAEFQVTFLSLVVLPGLEMLTALLPDTGNIVELCRESIQEWEAEWKNTNEKTWIAKESYEKES